MKAEYVNNLPFDNEQEFEEALIDELEYIKDNLLGMQVMELHELPTGRLVHNGGTSYRARVPSVGWGHINQYFNATVSNGRISHVSLNGSSFQTGISWGIWTHNRSWTTLHTNNTHLDIRMQGTLRYSLLGVFSGSMSATFLQMTRGSGNRLVAN